MNTKLIRDSYRFEVWLPASLVSWLDSRYPDDEPEVAIAKALKALQGRDRHSQQRTVQILERSDYATARPGDRPKREIVQWQDEPEAEPTPTPVAVVEPIAPTPTTPVRPIDRPAEQKLSTLQSTALNRAKSGDPVSWIHQFCQLSR